MRNVKAFLSVLLLLAAPLSTYLALPAAVMVVSAPLIPQSAAAANFLVLRTGGVSPPVGDGFFAANGTDSGGTTIGADCTFLAPCQTLTKALAFQAANIAAHPDLVLQFNETQGNFLQPSLLLYTTLHTPATGHTATWTTYFGGVATISAGSNMNGTWFAAGSGGSAAQTNAPGACASNLRVSLAPLTEANTVYYAGDLWFADGYHAQETMRPLRGSAWAVIGGTAGTTVGANVAAGATATFNGTTTIGISDMSTIGIAGDPILFSATSGGITANHTLFIASKSAATGSGTITVNSKPLSAGTSLVTPGTLTTTVDGETQSINDGDRSNQTGQNQFTYIAGTPFDTAVSGAQKDVKGMFGYENRMARVATINTGTKLVTLTSPLKGSQVLAGGQAYRVINRPEDLGTNSAVGEMRTDRTTGWIYYTPRAGETCSGLNTANVIAPGPNQTILRFSNSITDTNAAGGSTGVAVGNFSMNHFRFSHTNTSTNSCQHVQSGAVCGWVTAESSRASGIDWALETVGASNITFNDVHLDHLGSAGLARGWGSNHISFINGGGIDAGGAFIQGGMAMLSYDGQHFQPDSGVYGTANDAPTTNFWVNDTSVASNVDMTGASDSTNTISHNDFERCGLNDYGTACLGLVVTQNDTVTHNNFLDSPEFCASMDNQMTTTGNAGVSYGGIFQGIIRSATTYKPSWGSVFQYNNVGYCGYANTLAGVRVPGDALQADFGAFYTKGPGGDAVHALFDVGFNKIHDVSAGHDPQIDSSHTTRIIGTDGNGAYFDGNNSILYFHDNQVYNVASANIGDGTHEAYPTRLVQPTGLAGATITNNIFAGVQPAGSDTTLNDGNLGYLGSASSYMFGWLYPPGNGQAISASVGQPNYVSWPTPASGNVYSATVSCTTGTATPPTCTGTPGVTTCNDGTCVWTYLGAVTSVVPGGIPYGITNHNIYALKVTGSTSQTNQALIAKLENDVPQAVSRDHNLYSLLGSTLVKFSNTTNMSVWQATANPAGGLQDPTSLYGGSTPPDAAGIGANFVSIDSGNLNFNTTCIDPGTCSACSGAGVGTVSAACSSNVGYTPPDLRTVGP